MKLVDSVMPSVSLLDEVKLRQPSEVGAAGLDELKSP